MMNMRGYMQGGILVVTQRFSEETYFPLEHILQICGGIFGAHND